MFYVLTSETHMSSWTPWLKTKLSIKAYVCESREEMNKVFKNLINNRVPSVRMHEGKLNEHQFIEYELSSKELEEKYYG